jgi:hypothetical protein
MMCRLGVSWCAQELARQLQAVLDVREVQREVEFADVRIAHVRPQAHHRIVDRHGLGHERGISPPAAACRSVYISMKLQEIARVLAADEAVERQGHALAVGRTGRRGASSRSCP